MRMVGLTIIFLLLSLGRGWCLKPIKSFKPFKAPQGISRPSPRRIMPAGGVDRREATGVNFRAIAPTGTGYREATGVNFTAISPTGTGYREATGVDFMAISPTGAGYREVTGVDFTAVAP